MFASIFDGAQGLFSWCFDLLNFRVQDQDKVELQPSNLLAEASASAPVPTPKGSFEQIDREAVLARVEAWADEAPALTHLPSPTTVLGFSAEISKEEGEDADLLLQLAFQDANGLDVPAIVAAIEASTSLAAAYSPVVQPALGYTSNEEGTAVVLTLDGTLNADFEEVYLPLTLSFDDALGFAEDLDLTLPVWNIDLI